MAKSAAYGVLLAEAAIRETVVPLDAVSPLSASSARRTAWEPHSPEALQNMRDHLEELRRLGIEAVND